MSRAEHCSIDLAKFIFAFFVVAIHTEPLVHMNTSIVTSMYDTLVSLAVPFFFIASGYLVTQNQCEVNQDALTRRVKRHIIKLVQFYIIWSIIFFPLAVYGYYLNGDGMSKAAVLYVRNLIFQGEHYYSWPLWYLLSSIYAFIILYVLLKKKVGTAAVGIISILFIILAKITDIIVINTDCTSRIIAIIGELLQMTIGKGRIFSGIYYVLIGVLIAKYKRWISKTAVVGWFVAFIILFLVTTFTDISFVNILMNIVFFIFIEKVAWYSTYVAYLRRSSTVIYYVHMMVFFIYSIWKGLEFGYGIVGFAVTSLGSMIVAVLVNLEKVRNCKIAIMLFGKM